MGVLSQVWLEWLELPVRDKTYRDVLDALSKAIVEAGNRVDAALSRGDEGLAEAVVDEECNFIESLLGAAFIVCQTQIAAVTSRALGLREYALDSQARFTAFELSKKSVRNLGEAFSASEHISKVEMLWELANYFKHREEWKGYEWSALGKQSERTVEVIKTAGLTAGCTGNLRRGAAALGNETYSALWVFADAIDGWSEIVLEKCTTELSDKV